MLYTGKQLIISCVIVLLFVAFTLPVVSSDKATDKDTRIEVDQLMEKAEQAIESSPNTAVVYADKAYWSALEVNYTFGMARSLVLKGKALNANNQFEEALSHFRRASLLTEEEDRFTRGQNFYEQGYAFYRLGNADSAAWYFKKTLEILDSTQYKAEIALTEWRLALAYWGQGLFLEGLTHIRRSEILSEAVGDKKLLVSVYNSKGAILWGLASYEQALEAFFSALSLNEKENVNPNLNIILLNNIGLVYHDWSDFDNALSYFQRAEKLISESNHRVGAAYTWLNLGTHFLRMHQLDTAMDWLNKARDAYAEVRDINGVCLSKIRIGECYMQNGALSRAEETFKDAIDDSRESQNGHRESNALYFLGKNYLLQNNLDDALENSLAAIEISEKGQYKDISSVLYEQLSEIYKKQDKALLALEMLDKAMTIKDEIYREKLAVQYNLMDLAYEYELKEHENSRLRSENLLKQRSLYFMYAAVLLVMLALISISFFYLKLKKKKRELQEANHAKDKIFSIVAHDLRGPVGTLNSMIEILVEEDHTFNYKEILHEFRPIVASSFDMLENLLVWAKTNLGKLETNPVSLPINKIIQEAILLFTHFSEEKSIKIQFMPERRMQVNADKVMLETVIRNLLKNALKFTREGGTITIKTRYNIQYVIVEICDNGVGIPANVQETILNGSFTSAGTQNEKGSGLGLLLSKELTERNGGKLWFTSTEGEGSCFSLSVPLDPEPES